MRPFLIFILLFIALISQGQESQVLLTGICIDKKEAPIADVFIKFSGKKSGTTYTDSLGKFNFFVSQNDTLFITYKVEETISQKVITKSEKNIELKPIQFNFIQQKEFLLNQEKKDPFELTKLPLQDVKLMINTEKFLTLITSASSNNELTSNYNVRGGNYDENLVYVNGFNVYRPFLTRSGQQEGMSFIHSALVDEIRFSGGGFEAEYGDRLSSVLDIKYRKPSSFASSAVLSLLGVESHVEGNLTKKTDYLIGARFRSNGYFLNSLPTQGQYNPVFTDGQFIVNHKLSKKVTWSTLGHFSTNRYSFSPQTQKTDFGVANEAYTFMIYFDGQERTSFQTMMGGTSLKYQPNKQTNLDFYATVFNTDEKEYFDILGQYYINQLENDPSKEEYGDSIAVLGVGSFLNHARNRLNASILNVYHDGEHQFNARKTFTKKFENTLKWGVNFQHDMFKDSLSEWKLIDSAGYSLPQADPDIVELFETIKGSQNVSGQRYTGYLQWNFIRSTVKRNYIAEVTKVKRSKGGKSIITLRDTVSESASRFAMSVGVRSGYTSINNEFYVTPRMNFQYYPRSYMVLGDKVLRRNNSFKFSTGLYYQPPFYREFRRYDGSVNFDVQAQKSFHAVLGSEYFLQMWKRKTPFKLTSEIFYKYMWDINPYEIDNVRTRYFATNDAVAYAYGFDVNIHGEFVEGIESFFKLGLLSVKEDIKGDSYKEYYNAAGDRILFGYSEDQVVVDSATIYPGYIPRPTDQLLTIGAMVQDRMPGFERFSVQMGLQFGTGLPYGPPDVNRYKDTLRLKSYFRVDLGMSYDLLYGDEYKNKKIRKHFSNAKVSLEIFNLLGIKNVMSKQWIQDVNGIYFSVPNYLTNRRINLKLIIGIK
ncbi:MAG: TonB-dependent receptor plug domain-containing protein [Bacteroidota bacterium]